MKPQPAIFEEHEIRRVYDEATEIWWFSVVDIVSGADPAVGLSGGQKILEQAERAAGERRRRVCDKLSRTEIACRRWWCQSGSSASSMPVRLPNCISGATVQDMRWIC